jgi:hypothetical protein
MARSLEQSLVGLVREGKKSPVLAGDQAVSPKIGSSVAATCDTTPASSPDPEKADDSTIRSQAMLAPVLSGLALAVIMILMGLGISLLPFVRQLIADSLSIRYVYDGDASRFALIAVLFPSAMFVAFPCLVLVGSLVSSQWESSG